MNAVDRLQELASQLGPDEQAVVLLIAERLLAGRKVYGELCLASDTRDFRHEASEEALDAAIYLATDLVRGSA